MNLLGTIVEWIPIAVVVGLVLTGKFSKWTALAVLSAGVIVAIVAGLAQ
jgi:hypothetical protein